MEEIKLLDDVNKKRLNYFKRKFNIAIHLFFNPEMCQTQTTDKVQ